MITKEDAAAYIARGECDYTVTLMELYRTIVDLHTKIEELEAQLDHYEMQPDANVQHELIDNWGM